MVDVVELVRSNVLAILVMTVLILIGIRLIKRAREDLSPAGDRTESDALELYRAAFESGQMDEAEYKRILELSGRGTTRGVSVEPVRGAAPRPEPSDVASPPERHPDPQPEA